MIDWIYTRKAVNDFVGVFCDNCFLYIIENVGDRSVQLLENPHVLVCLLLSFL